MLRVTTMLLLSFLVVSAYAGSDDIDKWAKEDPCVDQNAAAGILLIEDVTRKSMMTPEMFKPFNLIKGEGLISIHTPCERLAEANLCGYTFTDIPGAPVSHLCPRSCGTCPIGNGKVSMAGDGSWSGWKDMNELVSAIYGGRTCDEAAPHGWRNLSCEDDAVVRALCGEACPDVCQRNGWTYESYSVTLKKIRSYQQQTNDCVGVPYNHCNKMKFGEAEDACRSWGARLCDEVPTVEALMPLWKDGFAFDDQCDPHMRHWVTTECSQKDYAASVVPASPSGVKCQHQTANPASPMCCAGETPSPTPTPM